MEGIIEGECPNCGSADSEIDAKAGFYSCLVCGNNWVFDQDDPAYDDVDVDEEYLYMLGTEERQTPEELA